MSVHIFLGPTLPLDEARRGLGEAEFLPPVRRGDVYRLVTQQRPDIIAIIDGLFGSVPAVVHKEILFAISRGVRVLGAASMGALRAAELWQFGMEGVGRIFEHYRSGGWESDDEVAVVHGPEEADFRATSVALATIRLTLTEARDRDIVSRHTAEVLVAAAKEQFYPDRSWHALHQIGEKAGLPTSELNALQAFVATERPDAKRDDAIALLRRVRELVASGEPPPPHDFDFEENIFWERLTAEFTGVGAVDAVDSDVVTTADLFRHVRVQPDGAERMRGAALLHLLDQYAAARHVNPTAEETSAAFARFRRRRNLLSADRTRQWLADNGITEDQLSALLRLEVVLDVVLERSDQTMGAMLPLELKRQGELAEVVQAVVHKKQILQRLDVRNLSVEDAGIGFTELLDWYQANRESLNGTINEHADQLGFGSVREFLSEVLLEYMADTP